jgi:chemotaxis protein MotA
MAIALLTTFYGVLAAHLFFLTVAEKLKQLNEAELRIKSMIVRGVLGIQAGEHPRIIQLKLLTFLPPEERTDEYTVTGNDMEVAAFPIEENMPETKQAA